jgi:hypothetical protein
LIHSFSLTSGLRMIGSAKGNMSSHSFLKAFPEPGDEEASTVENNLLWNTVKSDYPRNLQLCQLSSSDILADRYEMSNFG